MKNAPEVNSTVAFSLYYLFKILPILAGCLAIVLGYRLFILGVTGQASLSIQSKTVSGQLLNAAPGLFFAIGGFVTIAIATWKGVQIEFTPPRRNAPRRGLAFNSDPFAGGGPPLPE
jgi:hypothetical protein